MAKLRTSLCVTVKNESDSFGEFWKSILHSSKLPDEVVIVDGGSTDGTVDEIRKLANLAKVPIQLIESPGANRSVGRNLAIEKAKNEILLITDAGCRLDKRWVEEISMPLVNSAVDVVAGNYEIDKADLSPWALIAAFLTANSLEVGKSKNDFLASSRSFALKKSAWKKAGGYPDDLNTAEDLVFAARLKQMSFVHKEAARAVVFWHPPTQVRKIVKVFFNYSFGDGYAFDRSPHATRYGAKLLILSFFLLLTSTSSFYFGLEFGLLILWWAYQAAKLQEKDLEIGKISYWRIFITVTVLFWVTLAGFLAGFMYRWKSMRK